jgi:RimJ/RimL family protein N-acetyltransferase
VRGARLALRPAVADDAEQLLRWRNDAAVRAASFQTELIDPDQHRRWLKMALADPRVSVLVALADGAPVGQVRLEAVLSDTVEVHIMLAPEARGRGAAAGLLRLAALEHAPTLGATRVRARVKRDNEHSHRAFLRAGFQVQPDGDRDELQFELKLERGADNDEHLASADHRVPQQAKATERSLTGCRRRS